MKDAPVVKITGAFFVWMSLEDQSRIKVRAQRVSAIVQVLSTSLCTESVDNRRERTVDGFSGTRRAIFIARQNR
ncbi:hypothetical protein [Paraburkholderia diazotrophica]|uniref:Uncharacterized protein n=1 Tax=Paraburkholderia diazotrophica TaxID=667676 RepID=A0A1H6UVT9_9BURK|nr:hypothetical protein [Paraburkholderia diazotrophica]SEI92450.1 hypothetical protein SAMN05192539_100567 [Paraburkholderia diazotrophica]